MVQVYAKGVRDNGPLDGASPFKTLYNTPAPPPPLPLPPPLCNKGVQIIVCGKRQVLKNKQCQGIE